MTCALSWGAIAPGKHRSPGRGTASKVIRVVLHRQRSACPRNRCGVRIFAEASPTMTTPPPRTSCPYRRRPRLSLRSPDATRQSDFAPMPMRSLAGSLQCGADSAVKPGTRASLTRRLVPGMRAVARIVACPSGTMIKEHGKALLTGDPSRGSLMAIGDRHVDPRATSASRARARRALPASAMPPGSPGDACRRRPRRLLASGATPARKAACAPLSARSLLSLDRGSSPRGPACGRGIGAPAPSIVLAGPSRTGWEPRWWRGRVGRRTADHHAPLYSRRRILRSRLDHGAFVPHPRCPARDPHGRETCDPVPASESGETASCGRSSGGFATVLANASWLSG